MVPPPCTPHHHWWFLAIIALSALRALLMITFKWTHWQWEMDLAELIRTIILDWFTWFGRKK